MNPQDVGDSYDLIAHRWQSDCFPRDDGIAQHEKAVAFTTLRGAALDIGCGGSGRVIEFLLNHGFSTEGLDISRKMLELALSRHPHLTFHHADICRWQFPYLYNFISAWDSVWHVPLRAQKQVLLKILAGLSLGGVAIFTIGGTEEPSEISNTYMGPPMYHSTLGIPRTLEVIAQAGAVCRHLEYDQYPQPHVYIICQRTRMEDK
ncbi:class I SAM-dependent methyltransferase [Nitrosomonas eutropha]|uniref:Methyltransferase family protein n=2 Tax=Nitrosomonas eutropha TaxID=916 RepID=A0ABX5M3C2_9PROT|nr:class I SAM-dependent methyltransferase [Nitrosomonas eutropha]ABI59316.1 Methyltransferase type 12 [Nitrosomonas eutropha C91]PXV73667.1 methyltransferase family protein [Nitrosomonas eutropha]SCX29342.1 Methyltransferase domain-containing protein [Nitrosomonas eutropha]SEJ32440.1 Methyltransferase domain-containing protein [Nitrosomonas eutropha]